MRFPGEQTTESWVRSILARFAKLERGDYWRSGAVEVGGVLIGNLTLRVDQNESTGIDTLVVYDSARDRTGIVGIIWQDEEA